MELLVRCQCIWGWLTADIRLVLFRYNWTIALPAELSAASVLIGFWNKEINPAVWIVVCMVVVIAINLLGAGERWHLVQNYVPG